MVLKGEAKKLYQREYMRWRREALIPGKCQACNKNDYIQAHHEDYSKPSEVIWLCAACHKKVHLIKAGKQRKKFNPYKNPLGKIKQLEAIGLTLNGNKIVGVRTALSPVAGDKIPLYNPYIHRPGDHVLVRSPSGKLKEMIVPKVDADGNAYT